MRAIAPEVGGGFGSKLQIYGEEIAAGVGVAQARAADQVDRVTRSEGMLATHHGRDQIAYVRVGATRDGKITAFHTKILADFGAYLMLLTPTIPSLGAFVMSGVYDIPAVQTDIIGVFTNKIPTDAIRGAGRPEATHMIEVMHRPARGRARAWTGWSCAGKNFMARPSFPHETAIGVVYDSGNYPGALDKLLEHVDVAKARAKAEDAPKGKLRGIGFSHLHRDLRPGAVSRVVGPAGFGLQTGMWESAMVRVHITGAVTVYTGTLAARPGAGDDDGADRRRPARGRPRRTSRSSTATPAPARRAWAPTARARPRSAASRSPARRPRSSTRPARSSRTSSRRRPRTSSSAAASSRSRARPTRA